MEKNLGKETMQPIQDPWDERHIYLHENHKPNVGECTCILWANGSELRGGLGLDGHTFSQTVGYQLVVFRGYII